MEGPQAVIHTEPAPRFKALITDMLLQQRRITLELRHPKNPNKSPIAGSHTSSHAGCPLNRTSCPLLRFHYTTTNWSPPSTGMSLQSSHTVTISRPPGADHPYLSGWSWQLGVPPFRQEQILGLRLIPHCFHGPPVLQHIIGYQLHSSSYHVKNASRFHLKCPTPHLSKTTSQQITKTQTHSHTHHLCLQRFLMPIWQPTERPGSCSRGWPAKSCSWLCRDLPTSRWWTMKIYMLQMLTYTF